MVRIVRVSKPIAVKEAVKTLKSGGLVIFPTETSYGIGADAKNHDAVDRVYSVKNLQRDKKISSMVSDKAMVHRFFGKDEKVDALIDRFLPGPLTIIYMGKSFRIPKHKFCLRLTKLFAGPITATSANRTGTGDNYSVRPILEQFAPRLHKTDLIIDAGRLPKRKTSTVYDVDKDTIYRKGPISEKRIRKVIANIDKRLGVF